MATGIGYAGEIPGLAFLDDKPLQQYSPEQILNGMLSTKSYLSTTTTLAAAAATATNQQSNEDHELRFFKQIGKGQCGTVWALSGTTKVLKIPNEHKDEVLWNDFLMHVRVQEAFQQTSSQLRSDINLPTCVGWIQPSNTNFWVGKINKFPPGFQPSFALISERINPLPRPVCEAIVNAFAPRIVKENKAAFLAHPDNEDCLIRLYLGRRVKRSQSSAFRLRNFDLTINEMEHLRLDTMMYARVMAQTLAILHWKAHVDADDVEFVLGSAPEVKMVATFAELRHLRYDDPEMYGPALDFHKRATGIWLLDFNQCKEFSENPAGLKQLERAFFFNDPYYPRPGTSDAKDKALWECFKLTYLEASATFGESSMPKRFIDAVEVEGTRRMSGGSLFQ